MKMKTKSKYTVAFTGLQEGVHSFTYHLDDDFFEERDYSPVQKGDINIELTFDKKPTFFVLDFRYAGTLQVACDRCTQEVRLPINGAASLLVKFAEGEEIEQIADDEVKYIDQNAIEVDFSQFLYENIVVDIPLYKTCEDDVSGSQECDEKVISILENEEHSGEDETDPRWEKLKQLKQDKHGTSEE